MRSTSFQGGLSGIGSEILPPNNGTPLNSLIPVKTINPISIASPVSPRASTAVPFNANSNIKSFNIQ